jgi:hypothetical protein
MKSFFLLAIILVSGCSKQQTATDDSKLKPVQGAFGFNLGEKVSTQNENLLDQNSMVVHDTPPFQMVSIDRTADGIICQISGSGIVEEYEKDDFKKQLMSVLSEKYGAREKIGAEKYAIEIGGGDGFYFGTTNRVAHLTITDHQTNVRFDLEYSDRLLMSKFNEEWEAKQKSDDEIKKAAMSKGL